MPLILPKPLKEWSGDEIRGILKIFRDFDADKDGQIDEKEVEHLAEAMGVDLNVDDGDKYTKDGKIDPMEFFAFYSGCSPAEASIAFVDHAQQFDALKGKGSLQEYTDQEITDIMAIFKQFDKDGDGTIGESELQALAKTLMVDLDMAEADQLVKDGVVSRAEFFKFYTGCSDEEAQKVFQRASFGAAA